MYSKMLYDKKVLYFKYAPPMTALDSSCDLPNPPYRGAPTEQRSVYYYWWSFLRENDEYIACCEKSGTGRLSKLHDDFGDVRDGDFFTWWRQGGRLLFCEPEIGRPYSHLSPPSSYDHEREVLLTVPITGDLERTIAEIRALLKPAMKAHTKRASSRFGADCCDGPRYPVHTMPVLTSLHQTLMVWQAKKRLEKRGQRATSIEIGIEAKLDLVEPDTELDPTTKALLSTKVSRCLKAARNLIANVGEGRFPDADAPISRAVLEAPIPKNSMNDRRKPLGIDV